MQPIEPVRVFYEDGRWHADYGPGLSQSFQAHEQALEAAARVAEREGRPVEEIAADLAHMLMREAASRLLAARQAAREAAAREAAAARDAARKSGRAS